MNVVSGATFWPTQKRPPRYGRLRSSLACDVAVLGGGITGALVAHALAEAGFFVVVLDKNEIGGSSTGATTGLLQYETDLPLRQLIRKIGERRAVRSYELGMRAVENLGRLARRLPDPSGFAWRGTLYGATKPAHAARLKQEFAVRQRHGFETEFWNRRRIAAESTLPFPAAIVSRCGAEIDAYRLTHALFRAAMSRGTRVFSHAKSRRWRQTKTGVTLQVSGQHRVTARWLVVATGYEADPLVPAGLTQLHSTFALVTEPVKRFTGWPGRRLIWETARPYLYFRTTPDRRIMAGGADVPFHDEAARDRLLPAKTEYLRRKIAEYFPKISFRIARSWAATFGETRDSLPYIGALPREPDVLFALGYGGNGITFSAIAANILRDHCLGKPNPDAGLFRFDR